MKKHFEVFFLAVCAVLLSFSSVWGEEPTSRVTSLYNEVMARRLPTLGVECTVVPRLETDGRVVSASAVRQAIHDGALDAIADMLPESTYRYFASPEAQSVVQAIRAMDDPKHY